MIELVPLARASVVGAQRHRFEGAPFGDRVVAAIAEGRYEGERLAGSIVGAGGDWARPGAAGIVLLDVRQVVQTDDGALVYVSYFGRNDKSRGTYTIAPTFETADPRYAWLNAVQAIGKGIVVDGRLEYEIYEVR